MVWVRWEGWWSLRGREERRVGVAGCSSRWLGGGEGGGCLRWLGERGVMVGRLGLLVAAVTRLDAMVGILSGDAEICGDSGEEIAGGGVAVPVQGHHQVGPRTPVDRPSAPAAEASASAAAVKVPTPEAPGKPQWQESPDHPTRPSASPRWTLSHPGYR